MTSPVTSGWTVIFLLLLALTGAARAADSAPIMEIGVRASVDDLWEGFKKRKAKDHGRLYALVAVNEVPAERKLARTVDVPALARVLRGELERAGFREITAGEKADVVLTVLYGRGYLKNPYLSNPILEDGDMVPVLNLMAPKDVARHRELGFEAKAQAAQQEKLFLTVTGWKYPDTAGEKPKKLWKTTVTVDDPENRDLNRALPAMLSAASSYFDKQIKNDEVIIRRPIPEGTVIIGPVQVQP